MFKRHKFLTYQGYSFPWFVLVMWMIFLISGITYLIRFVVLR